MSKHYSEVSKEEVKTAVRFKLNVLNGWLDKNSIIPWLTDETGELMRDSKGELQVDFVPTNISAFCSWNGSQNCSSVSRKLEGIKTTNRGTLDQSHINLKIEVHAVCRALNAKAKAQLVDANKSNRLHSLEAQVDHLNALTNKQETEIIQLRDRHSDTEIKLRIKERFIKNKEKEHEEQIRDLDAKISELTSLLRKVTPLTKRNST